VVELRNTLVQPLEGKVKLLVRLREECILLRAMVEEGKGERGMAGQGRIEV
jgi:hypothetical protein